MKTLDNILQRADENSQSPMDYHRSQMRHHENLAHDHPNNDTRLLHEKAISAHKLAMRNHQDAHDYSEVDGDRRRAVAKSTSEDAEKASKAAMAAHKKG